MEKLKDYNDLYNMITSNYQNMARRDLYQIITELIYTISEDINEQNTIKEINYILGNEE